MNSIADTRHGGALAERGAGAFEEIPDAAANSSFEGKPTADFSSRTLGATEWQVGRPVSGSDRPPSDSLAARAADVTASVDRISGLVVREAALVRQYRSDSMSVVLRPDPDTELYVHLSQRNGQIEATIRCERGDAQQLGALWPQLQESLAQQKVRLAPLQESSSNPSSFQPAAGSDQGGAGHGSRRPTPDQQSMDEWPAPAASASNPPHTESVFPQRGRGGSGHRPLTTSRPGWETWA